jgi:hypothetical protein
MLHRILPVGSLRISDKDKLKTLTDQAYELYQKAL